MKYNIEDDLELTSDDGDSDRHERRTRFKVTCTDHPKEILTLAGKALQPDGTGDGNTRRTIYPV
jgi:hypothetical protein